MVPIRKINIIESIILIQRAEPNTTDKGVIFMADLTVKSLQLANPFIVASSPATQGADNVLKTARIKPGAIVLRNFGHGKGGGSYIGPDINAWRKGRHVTQSHAVGTQIPDPIDTLEKYCEEIRRIKREMDPDIKLWASVGHFSDIAKGGDWEKDWVTQARELTLAGADALELHFNTPGVAATKDRTLNYYQLVGYSTRLIKANTNLPVMAKLAVENCDALTAIRQAVAAGADAVGPTARWKMFDFDLDWKRSEPRPGGGAGGTQAAPIICYVVAETRSKGIDIPMYAGGGVFTYEQALKILMAGSQCVQLGSVVCSCGIGAAGRLMKQAERWMDEHGYATLDDLCGDALKLFNMPAEVALRREKAIGAAYKGAVDAEKCIGCGQCYDVCWNNGIEVANGKAVKKPGCIGCGYCYQVCPTGALYVDKGAILKAAFDGE